MILNKKTSIITLAFLAVISTAATAQNEVRNNQVRVLTFNILHGATTEDNLNLDTIAAVINKTNPDLVALQEVDFKTKRVNNRDILSELAVKTGLTPIFIKAMNYDDGEYGEGLLSNSSFIKTENISLPHSKENEPKAAGLATLSLPSGDTINFIGTHFDHLPNGIDRMAQAKSISRLTKKLKYPSILAGDLNDVPGSPAIKLLEKQWQASYDKNKPIPTYPSKNPEVKIDYIMFYPKHRWKLIQTEVIKDSIASDHNAVLSVLELQKIENND